MNYETDELEFDGKDRIPHILRPLTQEQKEYDDMINYLRMMGRYNAGCTCHISSPCEHCEESN